MNTLLFMGHPGHELLAYKYLIEFKPIVVFLTTGSGNKDQPRIDGSLELLKSLNIQVFKPFEPLTDREVYRLILEGEFNRFAEIKEAVKKLVIAHRIDRIVGDALEGFNPSHDLCRYIINGIVSSLEGKHAVENFDFLQDEIFRNGTGQAGSNDIILKLNTAEMEAKLAACNKYSALKFEVDRFFEKYGTDFFRLEHFRFIIDTNIVKGWENGMPFYEVHGRKRVEEGVYESALLFEDHMKPLAHFLLDIGN